VDIDRFDPYCVTDRKTGLTAMTMPTNVECCDYRALSAEQADNFYEKIKRSYDYVLVDCGNIVYEALSCCALLHAKKTFIVLPQEKRSAVWLTATEAMLEDLQLSKLQYIITQLQEVADVTIDQVLSSIGDSGSTGILGGFGSSGGFGSTESAEGIASIKFTGSLARNSSRWSRLLGVIPYLFNLRDYQADGTVFLQSPSGKKSKEFAKAIEQLVREIEEEENV
jgi:cellulose biosynthesis protein BcsQ